MLFLEIIITIISLLISVAYYTLTERKLIASIQRRSGPNVVGFWGLLQPLVDGAKAIFKEQIKPLRSFFYFFILSPFICFLISLMLLNFISFYYTKGYFDEILNFIFFLSLSSFNVFGILLAGWSSNSKYALLGGLRGTAQILSFEMCFITLLLPIFLINSSFNIIDIVIFQINFSNSMLFLPSTIYFFIVILAETNRIPFDLPEAEAELVAGYNVEYSAINFAMFFLAEYTNMLINSAIFVLFFLKGWFFLNTSYINFLSSFNYLNPLIFNVKVVFISCIFIIVRALLPRYRFDQLMNLCWKKILPVSFSFFLFFVFLIYYFKGFLFNLNINLQANPYKSIYIFSIV